MHSKASIAKLREAADDQDPSVALAAAHALIALKDDSGYEVYYEVLTGERKGGKGLIASQTAVLKDQKKMAELGIQEGIGFIPFAGIIPRRSARLPPRCSPRTRIPPPPKHSRTQLVTKTGSCRQRRWRRSPNEEILWSSPG